MEPKVKSSKFIIGAVVVPLLLILVIGGVLLHENKKEVKLLNSENLKLELVVHERDSLVNEFISAFDTIESSLTFINEKRGRLVLKDSEVTISQKDAIIGDIYLMNTMLEESSAKIEELEKKLKSSGLQLKSFKTKLAGLSKKIDQQNKQIAAFKMKFDEQNRLLAIANFKKDSLQNEVASFLDSIHLKETIITQREEIIGKQIGELNKGFFAYGTSKELVDNGVITRQGGFLGFGRNKSLLTNFNEDYFTKIDISEQRFIELNVKKVSLISEHPHSSYRLVEEDGLITKLEIETPEDFWKISQYAVIEVK